MTSTEEEMPETGFLKRLRVLGPERLILSYDTLAGVLAFFAVLIYTGGGIGETTANSILSSFATVSATLFAIVLTGLTIITSFTDRLFLYVWYEEVEEFESIVTTFQYNLSLPVVVLLMTLALQVVYDPLAMLVLIAVFVYMMFSLLDLVGLISRYSLHRAEFVKQQVEESMKKEKPGYNKGSDSLRDEELARIRDQLVDSESDENRR